VVVVPEGPLSKGDVAQFAPLPARLIAASKPTTEPQVVLGRMLYYESTLSGNHDVSCNSCHPLNAYGADGRATSFGDHGQLGGRNSQTVYNAAGQFAQFWDGRSPTVEEQAKGPILNPSEMNMPNSGAVLAHLRDMPQYRSAFKAAFPTEAEPVTYDNVGLAIGAFERGLVTPARWDHYLQGEVAALTPEESRGAKTFVAAGCAACHNGAYVGGGMYQKAGLVQAWPSAADSGRFKVTGNNADMFVFKVPSLRNVAMTSPYFHDGSVAKLDDAIRLMGRHQLGVELTDPQVRDIRSWMDTLTGEIPVDYIALPQLPKK
jgi:cytochrome c peroxidase